MLHRPHSSPSLLARLLLVLVVLTASVAGAGEPVRLLRRIALMQGAVGENELRLRLASGQRDGSALPFHDEGRPALAMHPGDLSVGVRLSAMPSNSRPEPPARWGSVDSADGVAVLGTVDRFVSPGRIDLALRTHAAPRSGYDLSGARISRQTSAGL